MQDARPHLPSSEPYAVGKHVAGAKTDDELLGIIKASKSVFVLLGSSWCTHCHEMFPHFYRLSAEHPGARFVIGQVDYMEEAVKGVKYTPTFAVWRNNRKVDQFWGTDVGRLQDRAWLHSDD